MPDIDPQFAFWFLAFTAVAYWCGMTIVSARSRLRNISDLNHDYLTQPAGWWRRAWAGALPQGATEVDHLDRDLKRAGYYGFSAVTEFLASRNLLVVGLAVSGIGAAVVVDPETQASKSLLWGTLVVVVIAYTVPRMLLRLQAGRRLHRIETGLPDALDLIRMCLTGGLPLRDSLSRVAGELEAFHPDLAIELEIIRRHADADTMAKALKEFSRRLNTPDINALASLVSQTERLGTHVAQAIMEFADGVRRQSRQRAEERASKTTIRLLFPVVVCLTPPVFILMMGPPVLQLKNFLKDGHQEGGVLNPETYQQVPRAGQGNPPPQ